MKKLPDKIARRKRRKLRVRQKVSGTMTRPRVTVYKSNRRTYLQAIDDSSGRTIAAASNCEKELRRIKNDAASLLELGQVMGERLQKLEIKSVVFDRNGYLYHGRVKALADGIRKTGVQC